MTVLTNALAADTDAWPEANQRYLTAMLARVASVLERHAAQAADWYAAGEPERPAPDRPETIAAGMSRLPALDELVGAFGLSPFERDLLLLCAGVELDARLGPLCAAAQGDAQRTFPTFGLALAALPGAHWSALAPDAALRRWRLIEVGTGPGLAQSPLRIDERVLHYLAGVDTLDERLAGLVEPVLVTCDLVPSHHALAERLASRWALATAGPHLPAVQLCGEDSASARSIAATACALVGFELRALAAGAIPTAPADLETLARLLEREAVLSGAALLLECDDVDPTDAAREHALTRLIEGISGLVIVTGRQPRRPRQRPLIAVDVPRPTTAERAALWRSALEAAAPSALAALNGQAESLAAQFSLDGPSIHSACAAAAGQVDSVVEPGRALWEACRIQARPRLDDLAQRVEPAAGWDDLILPEPPRQLLREIAIQVRHRTRVYEQWGFASRGGRGLGISALFSGASGTGKTMAAEVLANELRLDLYRIDLSAVVSKYIGETEKNLRRVFDAAESGGAILLFDEADALFGKRSEVKDSHDRYANIEVSFLLQRMEAYRGLAILTTNLKDALDTAFLRRIRFLVQFPSPDAEQRAEIWRRIFPAATPAEGLDPVRLARLNVAGGSIHNIALHAAFLAADAGEPVGMGHLLQAARAEYAKLERPLTENETRGWR
jgi:hypothetical protein